MRIFFVCVMVTVVPSHQEGTNGKFDLIEESGCHDTEFRISCESLNADIAIFEATFFRNDTWWDSLDSCKDVERANYMNRRTWCRKNNWQKKIFAEKNGPNDVVEVNFRHIVNRRCSGLRHCSFVFTEDFDENFRIGPGAIFLRYACVKGINMLKTCNLNIDASQEGFVRSPGYPGYYIGETVCRWILSAPASQKVKVTFLDVSVRGIAPYEGNCIDWIRVSENGLNLLSTCGDISEKIVVLSDGSSLNVTFETSSKTLFPKRGILFYYKAVGCPSLPKPEDGYLINRNESFAHYRCCVGFLFPDTLSRDKTLKCYNENTWDGEVTDCVSVTKLLTNETDSFMNITLEGNLTAEARAIMETNDLTKDIILPSIIICALFIGNGIVLYIIYRHRKKLTHEEKIELNTIIGKNVDDVSGC